ncbi:hypothetical protein B0H14DRAFT_1365391 [Mycena olivaceomarginata]|nr:hypothetical protein B0H14DRAFT_1365391 [Mycena olivaceomarginata]
MRHSSLSQFPSLVLLVSCYSIVDNFSGLTFFDNWDFHENYDILTLGDVVSLNEADVFTQELALVNAARDVIITVDNFSNLPFNQKRNSVRITTKASYSLRSLWIIDTVHLPFGCSVWPRIWTVCLVLRGPHGGLGAKSTSSKASTSRPQTKSLSTQRPAGCEMLMVGRLGSSIVAETMLRKNT